MNEDQIRKKKQYLDWMMKLKTIKTFIEGL